MDRATATEERLFYQALPELQEFREVVDLSRYADLPESWLLVISDVQGSTQAIEAGRYKDVNAVGVACIAGVQNAVEPLEVPFVFGGDGATLAIPKTERAAVEAALRGSRRLAREAFDLGLRVGVIPISDMRQAGCVVRVARYRASPHMALAMFAGDGFSEAERWLKTPEPGQSYEVSEDGPATQNFEGFECRWRPVGSERGLMTSLLVAARAPEMSEAQLVYSEVIEALDQITDAHAAAPIAEKRLKMKRWFDDYSTEAKVRSAAAAGPGYDEARKWARSKSRIGRALMTLGASAGGFNGKLYRAELVENTDYRKFDDTLRMVIDLTEAEVSALSEYLEGERLKDRVVYGMHCAPAALVTCIVRSYSGNHVHFVDGADGGYALAAKQLKAQLRAQGLASRLPPKR